MNEKQKRLPGSKDFNEMSLKDRAEAARERIASKGGAYINKDGSHRTKAENDGNRMRSRAAAAGVATVAATVIAAGLGEGGTTSANTPSEEKAPATTMVTVEQGDSPWSLQAEEGFPQGRDKRDVVGDVMDMNGIETGEQVHPGDQIAIYDNPENNLHPRTPAELEALGHPPGAISNMEAWQDQITDPRVEGPQG